VAGVLNQMIGEVDIDGDGRVTFVSYVFDGSSTTTRIFSVESGVLSVLVSKGDTAPDTGGAAFVDVGRPRTAAPGITAFLGLYLDGPDVRWAAFLRTLGGDTALALPGAPAPGGGSIAKVEYIHAATPASAVAFGAEVDTGSGIVDAQFVNDSSGLRELLRDGQAAPAGVGGTFSGVQSWWVPALAADASATFYGEVTGGSAASGIFHATPAGTVTPVLLEGDAVTTPGGGTFQAFSQILGGSAQGAVVFEANVLRPPETIFARSGVFVLQGSFQREVVYRGDALPGTVPPRQYLGLAGLTPPQLNNRGDVAFAASIEDADGNVLERALILERGGQLHVLAKEGDPVPGIPGDTFSDFPEVRLDESGRVAFYAFTLTGTGVFLASPPAGVPALPPLGPALLVLALAAAGGLVVARRR
jgi:hypothetical protein